MSLTTAKQLVMPFLIINMGGEMLFILEQRLKAQMILEEKSLRVLQDVISTMFSQRFIGELFKPQRIYSNTSTRQIFDRLAHSSIMRLNEPSMEKLYDLMTMGTKYQILSCPAASDVLQVSLNHIDALAKLVKDSQVASLVENARTKLLEVARTLTPGRYQMLRQTLARFFQDRRIKVSLFLQDKLQAQDGSIIISHKGPLPKGSEMPGTIRFFKDGKLVSTKKEIVCNAEGVGPTVEDFDVESSDRPCKLGCNLYSKDRKKSKKTGDSSGMPALDGGSSGREARLNPEGGQHAKAELNLLANMIGPGQNTNLENTFNIVNLFPSSDDGKDGGAGIGDVITFDVDDKSTRAQGFAADLGLGDDDDSNANNGAGGANNDEADDLLALMDGL